MTDKDIGTKVPRIRLSDKEYDLIMRVRNLNVTAEGLSLVGRSTYTGKDGTQSGWTIERKDKAKEMDMINAVAAALNEHITKAKPMRPKALELDTNLLNQFTVTDHHLGMLAWGEETGADWDLDIAEDTLVMAMADLIQRAPAASTALFAQLGDFLHFDSILPVTPTSGHILDADTRFRLLIRTAIRVARRVINMLLETHEHVHVVMAEGNHDETSAMWLSEMLAEFYINEPRVSIDTSPDCYYCYEFGKTSLFYHHGHKRKPANLDDVFVAKFREVFGRTEFSYGHTGHLHNERSVESNLMIITQHRTLASPDAYASRNGWISGREASVTTYSKTKGRIGEQMVTPGMLI